MFVYQAGYNYFLVKSVLQVCHDVFYVSSNFGKLLINTVVVVYWLVNLKQLLTRTAWWVIPLVWLPVASWLVSVSLRMGLTLPQAALAVVGGIFIWTLMEYVLHRFLFHMKTISYWLVPYPCLSSLLSPFWCIAFLIWSLFVGETPFIIFFMVAITSTLWMGCALFSPLQRQLFCVCR